MKLAKESRAVYQFIKDRYRALDQLKTLENGGAKR